ncbi:hypothetical protein CKAH01_00893 [Colletotrichum kahawae]|uniref:Uncharacterized protein n=1 Tax=Colletotrichum kahawae TaxID=34407 RepID=A0AAD9YI26_COLKA|nr:hypothetical protein CKAH01_00893 [Colletotrichum kahawae]
MSNAGVGLTAALALCEGPRDQPGNLERVVRCRVRQITVLWVLFPAPHQSTSTARGEYIAMTAKQRPSARAAPTCATKPPGARRKRDHRTAIGGGLVILCPALNLKRVRLKLPELRNPKLGRWLHLVERPGLELCRATGEWDPDPGEALQGSFNGRALRRHRRRGFSASHRIVGLAGWLAGCSRLNFSPPVNRQGPAYMDSVCACLDLNFSTPPVDLDALVRLKGPTTILVIITITIRRPGSSQRSSLGWQLRTEQDRTRGRPPKARRSIAMSTRVRTGQESEPYPMEGVEAGRLLMPAPVDVDET